MKTPDEWYNAFLANKSPNGDLEMIERIQTEAWNEAIEAALLHIEICDHCMTVDKEAIKKLIK